VLKPTLKNHGVDIDFGDGIDNNADIDLKK
jgi:hypothetical protein